MYVKVVYLYSEMSGPITENHVDIAVHTPEGFHFCDMRETDPSKMTIVTHPIFIIGMTQSHKKGNRVHYDTMRVLYEDAGGVSFD
jgi:hypothetical protein